MVKVSVVVAVYNVEDYLEECLDSLINQTLTDIEIICINDGSADNSLEILERYAQKDSRIKVYSQENQGHAVATNVGMTHATGDYLYLMDSDDIIKENTLKLAYEKAIETDVDFVIFKAINYDDDEQKYFETLSYSMDDVQKKVKDEIFSYDDIRDLIFTLSVTPWSKLYKRSLITDNNIVFPEGLIFDDNVFFWEVFFNSEKISFLNEFLFIRRFYSSSSTHNGDLRFLDSIKINDLIWEIFKKYDHFDYHKRELYNSRVSSTYNRFTKIKVEYKNVFFQEMKKSFMKILENEELFDDFMNNLNDFNRNVFIQVLSTDNSRDFNLLRKTYSSILKAGGN